MSETVKVGRNRPPQNGWASKEEVAELRAEVAELRETNQAMLEEIKGLRAELGGAKRRHFLGAVATSAAAFFGKFFHRGEDLGDIPEEKLGKRENKRGAHAKGKEKEKEKGNTPIVSARRGEKSKDSREQEDKPNKNKTSGIGKKIVAGALALALVAGSAVAAFGPHKNAQDLPKDPSVTEVNAGDLRMPETEQALAEQAVEAAEAAHQQQLAETMGMSVEEMHAVADRHGVNHNDIGTVNAQDQMRDNMESDYNLSEKIDLDNMSEAERSERSKQEILFANMNNKYVTAQISSARLGAHDASDSELTRQLFEQYEENDAVWQEHAKENAKLLMGSIFSTRLAETSKAHTYGTKNQWDGPIEEQYTTENSGGETIYKVVVTNGDMEIQFKDGCIQAVWGEAAQPQRQVKKRTVVQREVVQQKEEHHQKERQSRQYSWNRWNDEEEHRQNDSKDPKANDTQQNADKNFEANAKANDDAPTYGGQKNPDASAKSGNTNKNPDDGSEVVPDDNNGSIGGRQDAKPGQQDWGDGGGAADSGQDKTAVNPGDQGGSGKGTTGGNQTDSGGGGKETDRRSSSQHRSSHSEEGGTETTDENGKTIRTSYKNASSTGWVNDDDTHSGSNQADGDVELQNIVVPGA